MEEGFVVGGIGAGAKNMYSPSCSPPNSLNLGGPEGGPCIKLIEPGGRAITDLRVCCARGISASDRQFDKFY